MKTIHLIGAILLLLFAAGCDHKVEMATQVREDGSLAQRIEIENTDESNAEKNYFGITADSGWEVTNLVTEPDGKVKKSNSIFTKEFYSVEDFNKELNRDVDSLFQMEATFNKEFRWFYTYLTFTETIKAADRFNNIKQSDYFTPEEYAFIDRLPAEGDSVTMADSVFAEALSKKIMDVYGIRGIFEDHFAFFEKKIDEYGINPAWKETIRQNKEELLKRLTEETEEDLPDDFLLQWTDSLGVPYPHPQIETDFALELMRLENELNFMSWVTDGTFINHIEVPWTVVSTNADQADGNQLTWKPPTIKLLLTDYTMEVQSRKLNYWAVIVTLMVLVVGAVIFFRKR